jgi:acetyl esterase/lipase
MSDRHVSIFTDQIYSRVEGVDRLADVFSPTAGGRAPVILFLHGGGWRFGDRRLGPDLKRYFASAGFAMVSIDYRLSGEAIFPAAVEDVKTAIRWIRKEAATYRFNADHIGLWGSSAGGHLASMAALTSDDQYAGAEWGDFPSQVNAVVNGYGPTDFAQQDAHRDPDGKPSDDPESIQLPPGKRSSDPDSLESLFIGAPIEAATHRVQRANPIRYVKPGSPPFLIMHGLSDTAVPYNQSELLYRALAESGGEATLALIEKLGHGFFNRNNLDDAGPRQMRVWRCEGGRSTGPSGELHDVFGFVRDFFSSHLAR